jgi:hypothetical protein
MLAIALLASFLGCGGEDPTTAAPPAGAPPPAAPGDPAAQTPAPAPADGTAPPADGAAPPGDAAAAPPAEGGGQVGNATGFDDLVKTGKSITVSGTIKGGDNAIIDFAEARESAGGTQPFLMEQVKTKDGTFKIKAPAGYANPIYVMATIDSDGNGPSPNDPVAVAPKPLKLGSEDVSLELTVSTPKEVAKYLPWGQAALGAPPPAAGAKADGSGAPAGAPPAGGAPAAGGAAPADGAPPAGGAPPAAPG